MILLHRFPQGLKKIGSNSTYPIDPLFSLAREKGRTAPLSFLEKINCWDEGSGNDTLYSGVELGA